MFGNDTYNEDIKNFKKVLSTEAEALLFADTLTVAYIGRGSCPYCRKFAKKLSGLADKINTTIYYIDSEDFADDALSSFREKYNIRTVPGFIVSKQNEIEIRCDSSLSEDEILSLTK